MESRIVVHELISCLGNGCSTSEHTGGGRNGQDDMDRSDKAQKTGDVMSHCSLACIVHLDICCLHLGRLGEHGEGLGSERRRLFSSQLDSSLLTNAIARVDSTYLKKAPSRYSYSVAGGDYPDRTATSLPKHDSRINSEGGFG